MTKTPVRREPEPQRHEHHIHQQKGPAEWALEIFICYMYKGLSMTSKDVDGCLTHNDSN